MNGQELVEKILGLANVMLLTTADSEGTLGAELDLSDREHDAFEMGVCLGIYSTLEVMEGSKE